MLINAMILNISLKLRPLPPAHSQTVGEGRGWSLPNDLMTQCPNDLQLDNQIPTLGHIY